MPGRPPKGVRQRGRAGRVVRRPGRTTRRRAWPAGPRPATAEGAGEAAREGASPGTERPHGRRTGTRGKPTGITPPHHSRGTVPPRLRLRVGPKPTETRAPGRDTDSRGRTKARRLAALDPGAGAAPRHVQRHAQEATARRSPKGRHTRERGRDPPDPDPPATRRDRSPAVPQPRERCRGGGSEATPTTAQHEQHTHATRTACPRHGSGRDGAAREGPHATARHEAHSGGPCAVSQETAKEPPFRSRIPRRPAGGEGRRKGGGREHTAPRGAPSPHHREKSPPGSTRSTL